METGQKEHNLPLPPADKTLFRKQVQRELDEIRQELRKPMPWITKLTQSQILLTMTRSFC